MTASEESSSSNQNLGTFIVGSLTCPLFDLEDLLGASAEVLGKGTVETSYKVTLGSGDELVVKRLRADWRHPEQIHCTTAMVLL